MHLGERVGYLLMDVPRPYEIDEITAWRVKLTES